ncbi:ATP-dependent DNA ligase [Panus rudis PR-1116 ss-1]|nr:ATP-dependent DNA ligase [Panus rudis PR-1116 ss-1]
MSKRSASSASAPSTPRKKKKQNADSNQTRLDAFFGGSNKLKQNGDVQGDQVEVFGIHQSATSEGSATRDILKSDEEYARSLARQFETEPGGSLSCAKGPADSLRDHIERRIDVIDVDADSDDEQLSSSTVRSAHGLQTQIRSAEVTSAASSTKAFAQLTDKVDISSCTSYPSLSVDPVDYEIESSAWSCVMASKYEFLTHALSSLSETKSRIAIVNILTNCLRTIIRYHPPSLLPAMYLLSNSMSPPYSSVEMGLGPSVISKAIQQVSGLTPAALKRLYNSTGDPGDVAFSAKSNVRTLIPHAPLTIHGVYESLHKIARASGSGAAKQKLAIVEKLLVAARGEEIRYLVRTLVQNLRVGAVRTSILTALARAMVLTPPTQTSVSNDESSDLYATPDIMSAIQPLSSTSKKKVAGAAREELNDKYARAEALMKRVYCQHPSYDNLVPALLEGGLVKLSHRLPLTVGIPLLPTLGSPTRSLDEVYDRLGDLSFAAEFKYDGQRAQIHATPSDTGRLIVKIFSRHLEDMTDKYPDLVDLVERVVNENKKIHSFIIDAEIVAVDPVDGTLKSFQQLSNRARKDVKLEEVKVAVCVFAFDLMYFNGQALIQNSFRERRSLLRSNFPKVVPTVKGAARFDHVQSCESEDGRETIEAFWQSAINSRSEGLMIKLLDSGEVLQEPTTKKDKIRRKPLPATYEPDKRTSAWLKLKKDYVTGLGDTLDLVPIGAWHGNGRKANWWSPILLALWDPSDGKLVGVCKCMSGFTNEFYKALRERYPPDSETCAPEPRWDPEVDTGGLRPEVYFKPQEVWEIRGADVTLSPISVAALGLVSQSRGLSLRFPRFIKVREDKNIEDASTPGFLAQMYEKQQKHDNKQADHGVDGGDLVDVIEESDVPDELSDSEIT